MMERGKKRAKEQEKQRGKPLSERYGKFLPKINVSGGARLSSGMLSTQPSGMTMPSVRNGMGGLGEYALGMPTTRRKPRRRKQRSKRARKGGRVIKIYA